MWLFSCRLPDTRPNDFRTVVRTNYKSQSILKPGRTEQLRVAELEQDTSVPQY
jgi:hypothetical protein